jgi:hypothetical protein
MQRSGPVQTGRSPNMNRRAFLRNVGETAASLLFVGGTIACFLSPIICSTGRKEQPREIGPLPKEQLNKELWEKFGITIEAFKLEDCGSLGIAYTSDANRIASVKLQEIGQVDPTKGTGKITINLEDIEGNAALLNISLFIKDFPLPAGINDDGLQDWFNIVVNPLNPAAPLNPLSPLNSPGSPLNPFNVNN